MPTAKHRTKTKEPQSPVVDMDLFQQVVDALPKGSDELRKARNLIWKKIAEPDISDEAVAYVRAGYEKLGEEMFKRANAKVKRELKQEKALLEEE